MPRPADYDCWRWRPASEPPSDGRQVLARLRDGGVVLAWFYVGYSKEYTGWTVPDDEDGLTAAEISEWRDLPTPESDAEHAALVARVADLALRLEVSGSRERAYRDEVVALSAELAARPLPAEMVERFDAIHRKLAVDLELLRPVDGANSAKGEP